MNTVIWGPSAWQLFHLTSLMYDHYFNDLSIIPINSIKINKKQLDKELIVFFNSLKKLLPCKYCRQHYKKNSDKLPINFNNMFQWSIDLHDIVNKTLDKNNQKKYQAYTCKDCTSFYVDLYNNYNMYNVFVGFDFINSIFFSIKDDKISKKFRDNLKQFLNSLKTIYKLLDIEIIKEYIQEIPDIIDLIDTNPTKYDLINYQLNVVNRIGNMFFDIHYDTDIQKLHKFYSGQAVSCSKIMKTCTKQL